MPEYFVGVDPGANGALAVIDGSSQAIFTMRYQGINFPLTLFKLQEFRHSVRGALIEHVQIWPNMPRNQAQNVQNLLLRAGEWQGLFKFLGIEFDTVTPRAWQKWMGLEDWKSNHESVKRLYKGQEEEPHVQALLAHSPLGLARKLFPLVAMPFNSFDGVAVALLIAELARQRSFMPKVEKGGMTRAKKRSSKYTSVRGMMFSER